MTEFSKKVYAVVKEIPSGSVMSYGEVALLSGRPGAHRAVGNILSRNIDSSVPCHRVIRADGTLGGYNGIMGVKEKLLNEEKRNRSPIQ